MSYCLEVWIFHYSYMDDSIVSTFSFQLFFLKTNVHVGVVDEKIKYWILIELRRINTFN